MFYAIRGAFAGYEREKIKERTARGKLAIMKQGKVVADSRVYGYDFDKENRCYTVNQLEAKNVNKIFKLYTNGYGGTTLILRWMNAHLDEYPPPNGTHWALSSVYKILSREMYTGKFYIHKVKHTKISAKKAKSTIRPQEEWIEMSCPRIIPDEVYQEACRIRRKNKSFDFRQEKRPHLGAGLLYCLRCGHRLYVQSGYRGTSYYLCKRKDSKMGDTKGCGARQMNCDTVDEAIWELLREICQSPDTLKRYIASTDVTNHEKHKDESAKREKRLAKIKAERKSIMAWFSQQLLTHEEATERLTALKKAEEQLIQENIPSQPTSPQMDYEAVCEAVANCSKEARIRLVRKIVQRIDILRTDTNRKGNYQLTIKVHFSTRAGDPDFYKSGRNARSLL
jgi:site-specific DNA recombinase